jgi:Cu+-exporting ATPase
MATVKDPVCGMELDSSQIVAQTTYKGQPYHFCSEDCRRTFEENPEEFVGKGAEQDSETPPLPR